MKLEQNRPALIARFLFVPIFLCSLDARLPAAEADLKPGDAVGPHNWEKAKGMVGENLLNRIKQGYSFKVKPSKNYKAPKEYVAATEKYSGRVALGRNGELLNYTAGLPFPTFDANDPQAGLS